jgi:hypothetical protein
LSDPQPTLTEGDPDNPEVDVEDEEIEDEVPDDPTERTEGDADGLPPTEAYDPANDGDDSILTEVVKEAVDG